jgi:hypothetical protein
VEAPPLTLFSSLLVADLVISSEDSFFQSPIFNLIFFSWILLLIRFLLSGGSLWSHPNAPSTDTMSCKYEEECVECGPLLY